MFEGLDDIDWGALESGGGGADIHELIRGLLDPDPLVREDSFGSLEIELLEFGYIHEAAVRAVPFLAEAATAEGVPDRWRVVEMVAEIGGAEWLNDLDGDPGEDDPDGDGKPARAERAVAAELPALLRALGDADPHVRKGACLALTAPQVDGGRAFTALRERWEVEDGFGPRLGIIMAIGRLGRTALRGRANGVDPVRTGEWLVHTVRTCGDTGLRIDALTELCSHPPEAFPADIVRTVVAELEAYAREGADPEVLRSDVFMADRRLGERVEDRISLLTALMASPDRDLRLGAVMSVQDLVRWWNGDDGRLAAALGGLRDDPDEAVASWADDQLSRMRE
ncbi:hypothetical protein O4J56_00560 [Nocardiopsis sp. RSe5-2]|uniref:HEAT repeat domain-containing protein n=1 Tax=Nocardiopsis endophytica TaxID=3018445 RepID=A0ABT4TXY8_9ACTN|nr:hypothetical protein [Nocardiopsis endophytica]MDA2809120.1 hypothetical protein [Nocardiopsis endophytica]